MKKQTIIAGICSIGLFVACATNPLTGKKTLNFVSNSELFPSSFQEYGTFLKENKVITGTADAKKVESVGMKIKVAAEKYLAYLGQTEYLKDYRWEYKLVDSKEVNAWCMPGGKIVVYSGILPITKDEAGLATVMGHEVSHALANHGAQRMSASQLQSLGAVGVAVATGNQSAEKQQMWQQYYGIGSQVGVMLPYSRSHEIEADKIGLTLMAIAGYNPDDAISFCEASSLQAYDPPYGWGFDPVTEFNIADYGDMAFDYARVCDFPDRLTAHIRGILAAGAGSLTLGGDHYITFPILRAYAEKYGPLSLLHFDAHSDTWPDDDFDRIDHGTMFYKAVKSGIIDPKRSVQVGIRTHNDDPLGVHTIDARTVHEQGPAATVAQIRQILGDHPTYLTFDIDALDPAFAPGTGTPVWGGLTSSQCAIMLRDLAGINMVGGDVVEVSPPYDTTGATAIMGAHVAVELMCLFCWNKRQRA